MQEESNKDIKKVYALYRNLREKEESLKLTRTLIENEIKAYAKDNGLKGKCHNYDSGHSLQIRYRRINPASKNFPSDSELYHHLLQLEEILQNEKLKAQRENKNEIEKLENKIAELDSKVKYLKNTEEGRKAEEEIQSFDFYEPTVVFNTPKQPKYKDKMDNLLETKNRLNKLIQQDTIAEINPDDIPF